MYQAWVFCLFLSFLAVRFPGRYAEVLETRPVCILYVSSGVNKAITSERFDILQITFFPEENTVKKLIINSKRILVLTVIYLVFCSVFHLK